MGEQWREVTFVRECASDSLECLLVVGCDDTIRVVREDPDGEGGSGGAPWPSGTGGADAGKDALDEFLNRGAA